MKKSMLIGLAAATMLAGCNQAEIVEQNPDNAIAFGAAFVDNMTKVTENQDYSRTNIPSSAVYAKMRLATGEYVAAFEGVTVDKNGNYQPKQYWQKDASYWFEAFAPAGNSAWDFTFADNSQIETTRGNLAFDNETAAGQVDLMAAVPVKIRDVKPSTQEKVALNFKHQLSRVKVKFVNLNYSSAYDLVFENVKITNAVKSATMNIKENLENVTWTAPQKGSMQYVLNTPAGKDNPRTNSGTALNSVMTEHVYLIPDQEAFTVSFDIVAYQQTSEGEKFIKRYSHVVPTAKINGMAKGNSYILTATITEENIVPPIDPDDPDKPVDPDDVLHYIEFTVDVDPWGDWNDVNTIPVPDTPVEVLP